MASPNAATVDSASDVVAILEKDHNLVKDLFAKLTDQDDTGTMRSIVEELKAALTVHNALEENLVYPAIRVLAGRKGDADTLYHQQDEAEVALWEIDNILNGSLDADDLKGRVEALQKAVLGHIRKEEETEFPHLRDALGSEEMSDLTRAAREFRQKFRFNG
jgi:hemerythrin superfamily protein